jgi:hypothetical protein
MEMIARESSVRREGDGGKIHLQRYIEKLGRDRLRVGKY